MCTENFEKRGFVYYEDFGASGDGITNDFQAMKRTHDYANEHNITVRGKLGSIYLIREAGEPISVKTNTDFGGAKLIFDDTALTSMRNTETGISGVYYDSILFRIDNDYPYMRADERMLAEINSCRDDEGYILRGLETGGVSERINLKLGYPAFLLIKNAKKYSYIRYGFMGHKGAPQREVLLIDGEGNISPETPMLHDYRDITEVVIMRIDVRPITIKNAVVETRASRINHKVNYYVRRNFAFERPNVTFENIEHYITGEIPRFEPVRADADGLSYSVRDEGFNYDSHTGIMYKDGKAYTGDDVTPFLGLAYNGFVDANVTHNIHFKSCSFQSHVLYIEGTYDISGSSANRIVFEDCTQSNFFEKDSAGNDTGIPNMSLCWGVAGTNYCKNMDYIRCRLTRYDAHAGVVNGKVIDSEITVLRLIGGGDFLMEGTRIYARYNTPIQLREDYGASFNGTLTIRNCEIIDTWGTGETVRDIISAPASYWDMGYRTFFPSLIIDNLTLDKTAYAEIALVRSNDITPDNYYAPCVGVIKSGIENPSTRQYLHISMPSGADKWVGENIEREGAPYHGFKYEVYKNNRGGETVRIHDTKNRFPYTPPRFIEVKNNEENGYQLTLYNSSFFENTEIRAEGDNLLRRDAE